MTGAGVAVAVAVDPTSLGPPAGAHVRPPRTGAWRRRLARELAWRPEWPAAVLAGMAWAVLIVVSPWGHGAAPGHGPAHHAPADPAPPVVSGSGALAALSSVAAWGLMTTAMMTPVTLPAVRHVALNSLRRRRLRSMTVYLATYLAGWTAFGAVPLAVTSAATGAGADRSTVAVGLLAVATSWQLSPRRRRALAACRRTVPLPPRGWRADRGCIRFGLRQARSCVASCGPLMSTMVVAGHSSSMTMAMAALTVLVVAERTSGMAARLTRPIASVLAAATLTTALAAWS